MILLFLVIETLKGTGTSRVDAERIQRQMQDFVIFNFFLYFGFVHPILTNMFLLHEVVLSVECDFLKQTFPILTIMRLNFAAKMFVPVFYVSVLLSLGGFYGILSLEGCLNYKKEIQLMNLCAVGLIFSSSKHFETYFDFLFVNFL